MHYGICLIIIGQAHCLTGITRLKPLPARKKALIIERNQSRNCWSLPLWGSSMSHVTVTTTATWRVSIYSGNEVRVRLPKPLARLPLILRTPLHVFDSCYALEH